MAKVTDLKGITHASFKLWVKRQKFEPGSKAAQLAWQIEHNLKSFEELKADIIKKLNELHQLGAK